MLVYNTHIDLESRPQRPDHVAAQRLSAGLVLLNPQTGEYYSLDEVGARIWALCDGEHTAAAIAEEIASAYGAPLPTVRSDVLELLADLEAERLVADATARQ